MRQARVTADVQLSAHCSHCPRPAATRYRTPCSPGRGQVTIRAWERRGQASCRDKQRRRKQLSQANSGRVFGVQGLSVGSIVSAAAMTGGLLLARVSLVLSRVCLR